VLRWSFGHGHTFCCWLLVIPFWGQIWTMYNNIYIYIYVYIYILYICFIHIHILHGLLKLLSTNSFEHGI
jgi:cellulose synthase/poly-beta-1,6-N-acetylglucosamine synthase-like glycosyltransferase